MSVLAKLIKELSPDAIRWAESVAAKLSGKPEDFVRYPTTTEQVIYRTGEKLANLERLAPQMLDIYDDRALYEALDLRQSGIRFSDVPFLGYQEPYPGIAQIFSHEGRHRSRALAGEGEPLQLVRMRPYRASYEGETNAPLMTEMDPNTQIYSEVSTMQENSGGKPIGSLGELIKFLGLGAVAVPGALSQMGEKDG